MAYHLFLLFQSTLYLTLDRRSAAVPAQIGGGVARKKLVKLYVPERERHCEIVEGETTEEAGKKLAEKLLKTGLI